MVSCGAVVSCGGRVLDFISITEPSKLAIGQLNAAWNSIKKRAILLAWLGLALSLVFCTRDAISLCVRAIALTRDIAGSSPTKTFFLFV